jgi:hypothetical protein
MIARAGTSRRIGWAALFLRAYGLAGLEIPELRQVFMVYPWNRIYEHPHAVASISIHRDDPDHGGKRLIWARIGDIESKNVDTIQHELDRAASGPLNEVFKDGYRVERLPTPLRRLSWWIGMTWQGRQKAKKIGTCSISTLAGEGVLNRAHPLIVTSSIAYDRCDAEGNCLATLLCDHRIIDGVLAAKILGRIEHHMNNRVVEELRRLAEISSASNP